MRISQAGLSWSKRQYIMISVGIGLALFVVIFLVGGGVLAAAGAGFAGGFGVPRWLLAFLKKRRETSFLHVFPDAVDVIVRGVKAGLPLGDCLRIIANEAQEPVRSEFKTIVEAQTVGISMGDACAKLYERMPLAEANFFGIVVSIQQRAGGNLSEALGNLSRVLRDRKKMKAKIQAMSMEAKASAGIIGSLPPIVMLLVYLSTPDYISLLWTHPTGQLMLVGCVIWMSMGIFVMKRMINFDF
jgi:tight adherence protein B